MISGSEWTCGVDVVAVRRVMEGGRPRPELTGRDRLYAARLMIEARWSAAAIGRALDVSSRTAERWVAMMPGPT